MAKKKIKKIVRKGQNVPIFDEMTWNKYGKAIDSLTLKIRKFMYKHNVSFDGVYGIPRGGLFLAVSLSHTLNIPYIHNEAGITEKTLVVDDISDTGKTLRKFRKNGNVIVTFHSTEQTVTPPDIYLYMKEDKWILYPWETKGTSQ